MPSKVKKPKLPQTREDKILARPTVAVGTYAGRNRFRKFVDRKRRANKSACRKGSW